MSPPCVDVTGWSPQQWQILAPRVRKIHRLRSAMPLYDRRPTPRELLFNDRCSWNAWASLARSAALVHKPTKPIPRINTASKLESLPTELIASILENSSLERSDIIALGLASETLWLHVLRHVEKDYWLAAAPMAGVEIACTGTYLNDLPESFAKDDLAKRSIEIREVSVMCEARKINWAAIGAYDAVDEDAAEPWLAALKAQDTLTAGIPTSQARKMVVELSSSKKKAEVKS
ncbi:hypothetical protein H2199_004047 [Coniosporium tulheliwenetii]|uniref:Uncharacterized protein n=1 Tax=Coniosporium tulheliwenetii TaxID=3383036 RepID=A0ACC2Z767_9PEZI|nr:hypothetical protein H2199_004047 [Cladosporium sp. JES 115]